jgi:hypothetical protein
MQLQPAQQAQPAQPQPQPYEDHLTGWTPLPEISWGTCLQTRHTPTRVRVKLESDYQTSVP